MLAAGLIDRLPRLAVIQAEHSAPFYHYMRENGRNPFKPIENPETLATAIRIGDPVSWPKAEHEIQTSNGVVECVSETEIADAKAQIGACGIGCEPASAATLAGIKKLVAAGVIRPDEDIVAVLTGHVLKDPDYILKYHTEQLKTPDGSPIPSAFANAARVVPNDAKVIADILSQR
jgi:threonine synthase